MSDRIIKPQDWIDGLVKKHSPTAEDTDCAIQNMGIRIEDLEAAARALLEWDKKYPFGSVLTHEAHKKCQAEADAIIERFRALLEPKP